MSPTRRRPAFVALAAALLLAGCGIGATPTPRPACPTAAPTADAAASIVDGAERAVIVTNKGELTMELEPDGAPIAVANFVGLARCGFYDGVTFHRVIPGFVAQAGDPQTRDNHDDFQGLGSGSPGYRFEVEFPPEGTSYERYMVAMANAIQYDQATGEITGPTDSNGSQFFVMLDDVPSLRPYYSVLGRVTSGTDVVDAIAQVPTNGVRGVPLDPVVIEAVRIEAGPLESPE
ncbi:MAG TPA: peptidylprolyl isomerase [Candidatus Limnocylindria bacterium]|jgi:dolichyl-diphosphooligosaccharide--protein glycosyltransferase